MLGCQSTKKQKKKKKKRAQEVHVMHTATSMRKSMILIDSACSKSNHPNEQGLQKITTKLVRMFTANRSSTLSTKEGTLIIEGLPVRVSVVPTFDKLPWSRWENWIKWALLGPEEMGSGPSITQMALSGLHFNLVRIIYTTLRQQNNNKINNKNNDGTFQTRESNLLHRHHRNHHGLLDRMGCWTVRDNLFLSRMLLNSSASS